MWRWSLVNVYILTLQYIIAIVTPTAVNSNGAMVRALRQEAGDPEFEASPEPR